MKDKPEGVFLEMPCLTEKSSELSGSGILKRWFKNADARHLAGYLQKFTAYNRVAFSFLQVEPSVVGTDAGSGLIFRTSNFIGAVPLRSPSTGKQIGDFIVSPRFSGRNRFEEYVEILDLLGSSISPEFLDTLPLASGSAFRPPLYLEAVNFVTSLEEVMKRPWRKFDSVFQISKSPNGSVDWHRYALAEAKIENRLRFPLYRNVLSESHLEYSNLSYVFDICKRELLGNTTPPKIKTGFQRRLHSLTTRLAVHPPIATSALQIRSSDPQSVKRCKSHGNNVLQHNFVRGVGWRVDFNEVFERFVQHVWSLVAATVGGHLFSNLRIAARTNRRYGWELRHLEPDAVFSKGNVTIAIDAKYKSHLFNKYESTQQLLDAYRRDLHQVLAYSALTGGIRPIGVICYPSTHVETKTTSFLSPVTGTLATIVLFGIPLKKSAIQDAVQKAAELVDEFGS
jgi:hypothetical protein